MGFRDRVRPVRVPDEELEIDDALQKKVHGVAHRTGMKFRYTYDFGDNWEHEILVEATGAAEPGIGYPRCVAGRRACPPEDCGGIWGYQYLLEVLADPDHEAHDDRLDWLGLESPDELAPEAFDIAETNRILGSRVLLKP